MYQVRAFSIDVPCQVLVYLQLQFGLLDAPADGGLIVCLVSHCLEG